MISPLKLLCYSSESVGCFSSISVFVCILLSLQTFEHRPKNTAALLQWLAIMTKKRGEKGI